MPVDLFSSLAAQPWSIWLDSGESEHIDCHFDIFVWQPELTLCTYQNQTSIHHIATNITQTSVTQHQAALSITESQISDLSHYSDSDVKTKLNAESVLSSSAQVISGLEGQDLTVGSLTATNYIVSSSVTHMTTSFSSGSTIFGDDIGDTHQMTGSLFVSGSISFFEIDGGSF